jgi:hypothetical protein
VRAEAWLFAPGPARRLAALRIGLCAILAVRLATGPYLELAAQPAVLFRPVWFLAPLGSMPPVALVRGLQVVGVAAALAATVGLFTRVSLPLAWLAAVPLMGMTSSLGKVVHNDVLLLLCLVPLLAAPAGAAWSLDARRRPGQPGDQVAYGWPVRTATVVVAGAYFFSGLAKLLHAGPGWAFGDNLRWVLYAATDAATVPNHLALFVADRPLLARAFATATLVLELAMPLVLVRPVLARVLVPGVLGLHAGIWATMGLNYWAMAATVVVVLVDWPRLVDRLRGRPVPAARGPRARARARARAPG